MLSWRLVVGGLCAVAACAPRNAAAEAAPLALDRLDPAPAGDPFLAVPSARAGRGLAVALLGSYARGPLVHRRGDAEDRIVSWQAIAHLGVALDLGDRAKLDVDAPLVLGQAGMATVSAGRALSEPSGASMGDLRLGGRLVVVPQDGLVPGAAVSLRVWLPTGRSTQYAGAGDVRYAPSLIVGAEGARWGWATSIARTFRGGSAGLSGLAGSEVSATLGAAVRFANVQVGPELYASTVADGGTTAFGRATTNVEGLLSGRLSFGDLVASLAAGPGLSVGVGTPAYRVLVGLAFVPRASSALVTAPAETPATMVAHGDPSDSATDARSVAASRAAAEAAAGGPAIATTTLDSDGDGVDDAHDACPREKGAATSDPKTSGCPNIARVEGAQIVITEQVVFGNGNDTLDPQSFPVLTGVAGLLAAHPEIARLAVDGHTDGRGAAASNVALSQRRAVAVVRWLVDHGVDARRLETRAFGPRRPIADNATDAGRAKNRRVEFQIRKRTTDGAAGWTDGPVE